MDIQEQIEWLGAKAEVSSYLPAIERQHYSDCRVSLKKLYAVYLAAKREVDAFDGGYGVTVKHLRKAVAAVKEQP